MPIYIAPSPNTIRDYLPDSLVSVEMSDELWISIYFSCESSGLTPPAKPTPMVWYCQFDAS